MNFPNAQDQSIRDAVEDLRGRYRTAKDWGAKGDGKVFLHGAMTAGQPLLTVSDVGFAFQASDVGKLCWVPGAGAAGASLLTTIQARVSNTVVSLAANASTPVTNAKGRFGSNDTDAIRTAVADMFAGRGRGGRLHFPRGIYLTDDTIDLSAFKVGLRISGEAWCSVSAWGNVETFADNATVIACCAPVPVFLIAGSSYQDARFCFSFDRLTLSGVPESGSRGLDMDYASDADLEHVMFDIFGDNALRIRRSINFTADHCMAQNSMMVHTGRSAYEGVFDVDATDCFISRCNLNSDFNIVTDVPSVSGRIAALVVRIANGWVRDCMLAQAEVGFVAVNAAPLKLAHVRCDINRRHGFVIQSNQVQIDGCLAFRNSRDGDGLYSGALVEGAQCTFNDFQAVNLDQDNPSHPSAFTPARRQRYAIEDVGNFGISIDLHNKYSQIRAVETSTAKVMRFTGATNKFLHLEYQPAGSEIEPGSSAVRLRWDSDNGYLGNLETVTVPYAVFHAQRADSATLLRLESITAALMQLTTEAPADRKIWQRYLNAGADYSELVESVSSDDQATADIWLKVRRKIAGLVQLVEEVTFPRPVLCQETHRVDGISSWRPGLTGAGKIAAIHSSGVALYVCTDDPGTQIGQGAGSGIVAGSWAIQAGGNNAWMFTDQNIWVRWYPGLELPPASSHANKFLGSDGASWSGRVVPLSNAASVSIDSASNGDWLTRAGNRIEGRSNAQLAALIRPFIIPLAIGEVTGLQAVIDDLYAQLTALGLLVANKTDIGHSHSGTTGSGGTPSHTHGVTVS